MPCFDIPEQLHTNGRVRDLQFEGNEKLFRRFARTEQNKPTTEGGKLTHASLSLKEMSVNREKYSENAADVLYNIKTGEHFLRCGIYAFGVSDIQSLTYAHPTEQSKTYSLHVLHEPELCMYPHSIIAVLENGKRIAEIKPSSIKTTLRDDLIERATILKSPQS
jgi:hypothetical protein